ncbi:hypothetical protein L6452_43041 [Arctium lappa]|uniref:Uncharacterized protein n=1 Tax=Arctium lappa TaxID=4217 RepID=A0ACB8XJD9_ARCLA|nr:hypothetical protein L6452_43041 [Arctium lappa]
MFSRSKGHADWGIELINAALDDEVPLVRSAACRAIGVIACFPQVFKRYFGSPLCLSTLSNSEQRGRELQRNEKKRSRNSRHSSTKHEKLGISFFPSKSDFQIRQSPPQINSISTLLPDLYLFLIDFTPHSNNLLFSYGLSFVLEGIK